MPRVTQLEKTRITLVAITLLAPLLACGVAIWKDAHQIAYPLGRALLTINAAYTPVLVIVFGFLWTMGKRPKPKKGDAALDLTANLAAIFVFAVTLGIPVIIYATTTPGDDPNEHMVLYSSLMHTLLSAAMVYYFGKPLVDQRRGGSAAAAPAAK